MNISSRLLSPYLLIAAACAAEPVELGYGTDSSALSDSEATASSPDPSTDEGCPCGIELRQCVESGEPELQCLGQQLRCQAEDLRCSAEADPRGELTDEREPAVESDPCGARQRSCRELGEPEEVCTELYTSCSIALRAGAEQGAALPVPVLERGSDADVRIR